MRAKVKITGARLYEYQVPKVIGSKGDGSDNFVIQFGTESRKSPSPLAGLGEATPRGTRSTGDDKDGGWEFLLDACRHLEGIHLPLRHREASVDGVRGWMDELKKLAADAATASNGDKPYRATLAGIEMALLDLVARGHGTSVANLLGERRRDVSVSSSMIRTSADFTGVADGLRRQTRRFPVTRVSGTSDVDTDVELLKFVATTNRDASVDKPIWLTATTGYGSKDANELVDRITELMRSAQLPGQVILEQPVPRRQHHQLAALQRRADEALDNTAPQGNHARRLYIMASQSVWDVNDLEILGANGPGCAAINIGLHRTGGILAGLDLVNAALRQDPELLICVSGSRGASDITSAAARTAAMVMPRLDHYTVTPPATAIRDISSAGPRYLDKSSNVLTRQEGPGFGVELSSSKLGSHVTRAARVPAPSRSGRATTIAGFTNTFEFPYLEKFNKIRRDSNLLEHRALTHGLETVRVSPLIFTARTPGDAEKIAFYRTSSDNTSLVTAVTTTHKQITRNLLRRAGVSVPEGRRFTLNQRKEAIAYGRRLGWPVVVKPQAGTGGSGVTANIRSEEDLAWAIESLDSTKESTFVVERHIDGEDYRFIVLDDRVLSVLKGGPATVVGDGASTVAELIEAKNSVRRTRQRLQGRPISLNDRTKFQLSRQGLAWDSVPTEGTTVTLSTSGNLALGGESMQVLDETHPSLLDMAVRAVRALPNLRYCGIDFLISDHRLPLDEQSAAICEMNSCPANAANHFPLFGPSRDVSGELFKAHCGASNIELGEPSSTLDLHLEIRGKVQGVGYRQWMAGLAEEFSLTGWVRNAEQGLVEARVAGEAGPVAAVASLAISGPSGARPESVRSRHCTDGPVQGFVVSS